MVFAVFAGDGTPTGGWGDLIAVRDTIYEARSEVYFQFGEIKTYYDWYQIVDLTSLEVAEQDMRL